MPKLIIPPPYRVVHGKPTCNHKRKVFKFTNGEVYEFCDECSVVWHYWMDEEEDSDGQA